MIKSSLTLISLLAFIAVYGQEINNKNSTMAKRKNYNALTDSYSMQNNSSSSNKRENKFELSVFDFDCSTDFWTTNINGDIQQWSLFNNSITGGDTVLGGGNDSGLAFCGDLNSPTFYSTQKPSTGIKYYDSFTGWQYISTDVVLNNNGGHLNDQYYMGSAFDPVIGQTVSKTIYYFDGINLVTIDSLSSGLFTVADIAVDTLGQAWVFKGSDIGNTSTLNVYDSDGLISSYNFVLNSFGNYGTFFLNDTLYIGMSASSSVNPNSITPVIINQNTAQLGLPISFTNNSYSDMASCQKIEATTSIPELSNRDINLFPNPTNGIINLPIDIGITYIEVYDLNGQMIIKYNQKSEIDLTRLPNGLYFVKISTQNGVINKKIIKE